MEALVQLAAEAGQRLLLQAAAAPAPAATDAGGAPAEAPDAAASASNSTDTGYQVRSSSGGRGERLQRSSMARLHPLLPYPAARRRRLCRPLVSDSWSLPPLP